MLAFLLPTKSKRAYQSAHGSPSCWPRKINTNFQVTLRETPLRDSILLLKGREKWSNYIMISEIKKKVKSLLKTTFQTQNYFRDHSIFFSCTVTCKCSQHSTKSRSWTKAIDKSIAATLTRYTRGKTWNLWTGISRKRYQQPRRLSKMSGGLVSMAINACSSKQC